uniref:Uncharacterized protein n=1 Tax=Gossypium raimondii TaxID=29730 RepID=A0A0D2TCL1_GOSRA|nr:hypothetical protein B456_008G253500 [Gossypium raimondii]
MGSTKTESYFVFMNYDPEYHRLHADRKHDELLASTLQPGTYRKTLSLVIVDGFAVEITEAQANVLRSANGVRVVEKNQELA